MESEFILSQLDRYEALRSFHENESGDRDPSSLIPSPSPLPPEISEEWRKKRDQTLILIDRIENRGQDIETSLQIIELMKTDIQSSSLTQRDQIISLLDQIKLQHPDPESERQIEQHKQNLLQQLEDKSKEKLDRLAQQRKQLERDLDCLDNSVSFSRSLLKNARIDQLVSHLPLISDQLNRLKEDKSFNQPPVEQTVLEIIFNIDQDSFDISKALNSVCLSEVQAQNIVERREKAKRKEFKKSQH